MAAERGEIPPPEGISERIRKQIVDVYVSQVVEQVTELPKTPSRDRTLQCTVEQILDVLVSEMVRQSVGVAKTVSRNIPQVVEELVEVSKVLSLNRVQQRLGEKTTETPAISFVEKIVEMLVTQTQEKTQQVTSTHVQHVVNTVKVEKPKIIKETLQRI